MVDPRCPIGELALRSSPAARVLSEHGLEFCCEASVPLADACAQRGLDVTGVIREIERASRATADPVEVAELPIPALIDHLISTHHDNIWARLPFIVPMAAKLAQDCRPGSANCASLVELVTELRILVLDHLELEEHELSRLAEHRDPEAVSRRLAEMYNDHLALRGLLQRVRAAAGLSRTCSASACPTERALHGELTRLECHIRSQILIEREVLERWRTHDVNR